jgi:hypothetical protein
MTEQPPEPLLRFHGAVYQTEGDDYVLAFRTSIMGDDEPDVHQVVPAGLARIVVNGGGPLAKLKAMMTHG